MHFGLGKNAQVRAGFGQSSGHIGELGLTVAGHHNRMACRHRAGRNRERHMLGGDRQAENRAGVQRELAQTLGGHRHHTGIVRTGGDLVEQNRAVGEHEQFHAEYAPTGFAGRLSLGHQAFNGGTCDVARPLGLTIGFGSRLPGLAVIAGLLTLADRRARHNAGGRRNSQYRQLTLQRGKRLNDHARHIALIGGATALLRFGPSGIDGVGGTHHRLAVTRRAHHRLDHARIADFRSSGAQLFQRAGKTIRCSRQAQFFVGQYAQALAVHANRGDFGARHHLGARGRSTGQHIGGDGLYLGHDDVRLDFIEQCLQFGGIRHIQRAIFMRHLLGRSAGIRVSGAHPRAQSHELDGHFLAQLTSAQKQHAGGVLAQRCAQRAVGCASCGGDGGSLGGNCGRGGGSHGSIYGVLSHTHILPCRDDFAYAGLGFGDVRCGARDSILGKMRQPIPFHTRSCSAADAIAARWFRMGQCAKTGLKRALIVR